MSGDTCLCPASGAKPKLSGFKGGSLGNKYVQLNVGGSLYYTTVRALTRHDTMLKAMFSGRMEVLTDKEGWILIDRCGKHFGTILNYLRDDTIILPQSRQEIKELMAEAKYYLIQGLVNMCQTALQDKKDSYQPVCNIPVITSLKEEEKLIESSTKPVVKLLYNRSNNKYSYTRTSSAMRSAAGHSTARAGSWPRCAAPPSCMPRRRSRPRWNFQRPESMRRPSTSYSTRRPASLTTPCWRPQAAAVGRLPPVKTRRPLNCGTGSAASMSSAIALTMTGSSATSLPIVTDETLRESGHGAPCLPCCGTLPHWPHHTAAGWVSAPAPRGMTGPVWRGRGPE
ncbi:TNF alpha induced protein 1 [Phyllostomus discolor]|uniref:BTB/POZ domain-containing adapter for CUL3-mediated RhoA degradation protein 2 n=2 Tax=Phyllostomus discolor TaxID=89673 RepID=A0A833ZS40_9CHIR|nr:TNF alpha induced protein 1 [Phyllostomus discolor]